MKSGDKINKTLFMSVSYCGGLRVTDYDTSSSDIAYPSPCIGTFEVEITVPEFDPNKLQIEVLENKLAKLNADHYGATKEIKDQIQRLLAIGHDSHDGEVV